LFTILATLTSLIQHLFLHCLVPVLSPGRVNKAVIYQVTGSSRQISPHNRTGTFNTTVDIKLKQWADSQLPIKSVEVIHRLFEVPVYLFCC
jgi:Dynamin-like GTPase OPA1 C-terminal